MFLRPLLCLSIASLALSGCGLFDTDSEKKPKKTKTELEAQKKKDEVTKEAMAKGIQNDPSFLAFVGRLRQAVAHKDRRELSDMLAPGFGYRWDQAPEGETPFDYWDKNNAWGELESVLSTKFIPQENFLVAPPKFALEPNYRGYRAGIRQVNGSWKLAYFVTGEDILQ